MKLVSLNGEGHRHLERRIVPFLERVQPDVLNLQEVFADDVDLIQTSMKAHHVVFSPMAMVTVPNKHIEPRGLFGIAQFSRHRVLTEGSGRYVERALPVPEFDGSDSNGMNRVLSWMTTEVAGQPFTVATTHFTWSPQGSYTELQAHDWHQLQAQLDQFPELILSGDFNSPRQGDSGNVFNQLSRRYRDNMPATATTTLDPQLHKAGALQFLVDGLFTTPEYQVTRVELVTGVSDHLAVVADISRAA